MSILTEGVDDGVKECGVSRDEKQNLAQVHLPGPDKRHLQPFSILSRKNRETFSSDLPTERVDIVADLLQLSHHELHSDQTTHIEHNACHCQDRGRQCVPANQKIDKKAVQDDALINVN